MFLSRPAIGLLGVTLAAAWASTAPSAELPLSVRITSPEMNAEVKANSDIMLAAEADAPGGAIAKVEFFDGDKLVGTATQAPFKATYKAGSGQLNFRLTAKVTDGAGRPAVSPPVTCVTTSKIQRKYRSYDYEETAENMLKQVRLWIPEGLVTVRGILVVTNGAGGDTRNWHGKVWYGEFVQLHDFAFLGAKGFTSHIESLQVMQNALKKIAKDADHPELVDVPYVTTGFSAGGGYASRLLVEVPDRVIASVPVCSRLNLPDAPSAASLGTPACIISGEKEDKLEPMVTPALENYRPKGALFGRMTVQGQGHTMCGQEVLAMALLDAAVRLRYPADGDVRKGPVKLKALDPKGGWTADNATWKSGLTSVVPSEQFKGDLAKSSWLPDEDTAFIYQAYSTYDRPLTITSPSANWSQSRVWDPGSNVTVVVDDSKFTGWKKLEFYDGAHKFGEVAKAPPQCTATDLAAGFHVFSVRGTDAKGELRPSNPVLVVVGRASAK
jgi:dienelactone hydrolase